MNTDNSWRQEYRYSFGSIDTGFDNINCMDLRHRTKLLNIQTDFYENYIDSIVEDSSSGKIDLQNLPCDELFRLFSLCAEIARTYGGGFWADYSHTTVQYYPDIAKLFPWVLQNSTNPLDRIWGLILDARHGDENARARLNALSDEMLNEFDGAVKTGLQYVSEYGCCVAMVCYTSGNVELGLIVDGIVIVCNVTLAFYDYMETGDLKKYLFDCGNIILGIVETWSVGKKLEKYKAPLLPELSEKAFNCLNEMQGNIFGELTGTMAERANYGSAFLGYAHLLETNNLDASVEVLLAAPQG